MSNVYIGVVVKSPNARNYISCMFLVSRNKGKIKEIKLPQKYIREYKNLSHSNLNMVKMRDNREHQDIDFKLILDKKELSKNAYYFDVMDVSNHSKIISDYGKYFDLCKIDDMKLQSVSDARVFYIDDTSKNPHYRIDIFKLSLVTYATIGVINYLLGVNTHLLLDYYNEH